MTPVGYAPKLSSGIELVDDAWGGLYRGGSYLVYGRSANDRDLIPALFAAQTDAPSQTLYLSSVEPTDVTAHAQRRGIDLAVSTSLHIEPLSAADGRSEPSDERLANALDGVVSRIESVRPERAVIDDFMPFVQFHSFARFGDAFIDLLERIDATDATLMLVMAEPANEESEAVIAFMRDQMTGALHIDRADEQALPSVRRVHFIPNIGHSGQEGIRDWDIRRWSEPAPSERSERRFRFSDDLDGAPSPRSGRWDDGDGDAPETRPAIEPAIPAIRLGRRQPSPFDLDPSTENQTPAVRTGGTGPSIPRIPLGRPVSRPSGLRESARQPSTDAHAPARQPSTDAHAPAQQPSPDAHAPAQRPPAPANDHEQEPRVHAAAAESSPAHAYHTGSAQPQDGGTEIAAARTSRTDREAFRARLQQQFLRQDVNETPFVLIALRMDRPAGGAARPFDFDFILDLVSESLRDQDDMLVDLERERLVVILGESRSNASQPFFARLKQRVQEETPEQAQYLMRAVSAIVVPNGEPFRTAEEFLAYALDED